jgi:hypothetical protein
MKQTILILLAGIAAAGCTDTARQFRESNTGTDSIAINFFKTGSNMDTVTAVKIIRDKKTVEDIVTLIASGSAAVNDKCQYDGSFHFFKNDKVVQDVFFNSTDEQCRQFLFRLNGKDAATELNDKARDFLTALKNK